MTPEYLARIRAIYEAALAKDAMERAAFLDQECQGDEASADRWIFCSPRDSGCRLG